MPVMLMNRSRSAVKTKQASLMADQSPSRIHHYTKPTPTILSLLISPKFKLFSSRVTPCDSDFALISPTSILDANPSIFSSKHDKPNSYFEPTIPNHQRFQPPKAFGLADLVKTTTPGGNRDGNEGSVRYSEKPINKMILFGSKLRVQIPSADFGIKSGGLRYPGEGQGNSCAQTKVMNGCSSMSVSEMELSEDYTCVTSHGPNPTTRHIFDNCVFLETSPSLSSPPLNPETNHRASDAMDTGSFLSSCYTCRKKLEQGHDIYIYRGEKAFCSSECRHQEMLIDQIES